MLRRSRNQQPVPWSTARNPAFKREVAIRVKEIELSPYREKEVGLRHECGGCAEGRCPLDSPGDRRFFVGWRLALAAFAFFAAPSAGVILGAILCRANPQAELAGGLVGLAGGLAAGGAIARIFGDGLHVPPLYSSGTEGGGEEEEEAAA